MAVPKKNKKSGEDKKIGNAGINKAVSLRFLEPGDKKKEGAQYISTETGKVHVVRHSKLPKQNPAELKKAAKEIRVATGIPGLDEVMEGGFKDKTVNLVSGGAGSGKSILCMQFLVNGILDYDEPGVYVSFEETEEKMVDDFKKFGWDLRKLIDDKKLVILCYTPDQVKKVLEAGGGIIRDVIESMGAKRVVIDSITAFTLLYDDVLDQRKSLLKLFEAVHRWGTTALITSEHDPDPDKHHSSTVEFETDSVILLYNVRKGDIRERSIEIYKMRGTHHSTKIYPMKIDEAGIVIFPEETVF